MTTNDQDSTFGRDVTALPLPGARDALLLVRPARPDLDAHAWATQNRRAIERALLLHGALLFRGFRLETADQIGSFAAATSDDFSPFVEESSPRSKVAGVVYTSTDYPAGYPIQLHNEYSYASEWPMRLYFGCLVPPASGGETPIASTRAILRRLRPATREAFQERGVMYVRNFRPKIGVSWQTAFQTKDKAVVEAYCRGAGIAFEWLPRDGLRTRQVGDAIVKHPVTGEDVWFNHGFFFNIEALEPPEVREFFRAEGEDALSTNTYFGDGSAIPTAMLEEDPDGL
ncbi:MAG: TauD/TfdA family dioxygenase [Minicystis sp.]